MSDPAQNLPLKEDMAGGKLPKLSALVSPSLFAQLGDICDEPVDLSGLSPTEILLRHSGDVMLIEQGMTGYDQIVLLLAVERPQTAVIVVSDHLPGHMVRALMKLQQSDILPSSASLGDVVEAAERLVEACAETGGPSVPDASAQCWAFRGAVGGAGVTSIAIESAFELARRNPENKICLIDLNVSDGMVVPFLDGQAKLDLNALYAAPERLDARLLQAWCWEHEDGVSVLAGKRDIDADLKATEPAILRLLDVACSVFDFVVVDMPRHRMSWSSAVMSAVDEVVIISELTVPSLHAAADTCRDIDPSREGRAPARLVLNRMFAKRRFKAEFDLEQAERAIQRQIDATISSDWDAARTAVNLGQSIAKVKPKSLIVSDVAKLVQKLGPAEQAEPVQSQRSGKLRRRG